MKIVIIGAGNMGGAIARGLVAGNLIKAKDITVVDPVQASLDNLKDFHAEIKTTVSPAASDVKDADLILLAVKPWQIQKVAENIKCHLDYDKNMIVSIAAGVSFDALYGHLRKESMRDPVMFRVMPNTAIAIRESMTFVSSLNASEKQEETVLKIFNELGKAVLIPENQMGAATALGSCGTAFAMRYIRAASEGGVELGFYPDIAKEVVLQTVKGAVELLLANGTHPETEIDRVTTPGGVTIKGLNEMEHAGFTSSVIKGLKKSAG
ncbi:MAG: pyrroline-5-carboxylate reductase [Candidatus Azobacteroides sp.]|nr:pyrroline-5-carboxylate reductase [Candidatus Azobacteroides sp.]